MAEQQPPKQETEGKEKEKEKETAPSLASPAADENNLFGLGLNLEQRYNLCRGVAEECIQEEELRLLLSKKPNPVCYDGFEPSGRMHIAQGILKTLIVNKLTQAGCTFVFWVADWFALLNNKMDGNLNNIQTVGRYMIEIWKACGMDMSRVQFLWASEEINKRPNEYWLTVMDIARRFNVPRIKRCSKIMGRDEEEDLSAAQILYPCMQCADIFFLKADICQLGMDQRKVNVLAREYCDVIKKKFKPIILSHHMLGGLLEGQEKMSKSNPDSAIFMEDDEAEINRKIKKAFCPPGKVEGNPCLDYMKSILFPKFGEITIERSERDGGNKTYKSYAELEADFVAGGLHPGDLKPAICKGLNSIIAPVREHFKKDPEAKKLLDRVKALRVTK
eukprot:TRINITY_DN1153_c0_g1_i1.p1 TRINITY_DN1153_c0_g1~~TRINITY_DN1153_c0_g1_i1.p1  ORF type:complete len:400 (+),score=154.93 TRINITY_DN1153_c0_g1_i1:31-1200(+)